MVLGVRFSIIRLDSWKFVPFGNLASRTSWLKGDPVATAITSMSFSFMVAMAQYKSSTGIPPCPLEALTGYLFWAADC